MIEKAKGRKQTMKFSLAKLMLLPVAFGLAFLIPAPESNARGVGPVDWAVNEIRSLGLVLEAFQKERGEHSLDAAAVNAWLAGQTVIDNDATLLQQFFGGPRIGLDPWRQPYRFVQTVDSESGAITRQGFYSCGRDGLTQSAGCDPDDLNTWSKAWEDYYDISGKKRMRQAQLSAAAMLTPIFFVVFLIVGRFWRLLVYQE